MYLLYVDESGGDDPHASDDHFVLAGIAAFERVPFHLSADVDQVQRRVLPDIPELVELRASAIWNGNGEPWSSLPRETRKQLLREVYGLLRQPRKGVTLFGIVMRKADFPGQSPIERTCEEMAGHFDAYLSEIERTTQEKQRGLMIFDKSRHEKTVQALINEYRTTGASFGKVKHLADAPLFTDSKITRMLQLADFVAYALYRRYEKSDSTFFDMIIGNFCQQGGVIHGLFHLNTGYRDCYCPACHSRRIANAMQSPSPQGSSL